MVLGAPLQGVTTHRLRSADLNHLMEASANTLSQMLILANSPRCWSPGTLATVFCTHLDLLVVPVKLSSRSPPPAYHYEEACLFLLPPPPKFIRRRQLTEPNAVITLLAFE